MQQFFGVFHNPFFLISELFYTYGNDSEQIEQFIKEDIPDATVEIVDLKVDGDHYSATVTSKSFSGKTRVEQHKMVYDAFNGKMGSDLHALKLKTVSE